MNAPSIRERMERANNLLQQMEQIESELAQIFGDVADNGRSAGVPSTPAKRGGKRTISAAGRARIGAAARARWAKVKGESTSAESTPKPAKGKKKRTMSPEARAKIAAAQKKRWAKQKV